MAQEDPQTRADLLHDLVARIVARCVGELLDPVKIDQQPASETEGVS